MAAPALALDHIAIAAARLDDGVDWFERLSGLRVPLGGRHPVMRTHNAVMSLGGGTYLEIIAIDADAGPAPRRRWFGLDDPLLRQRLAADGPMLVAWVCRSADLDAALAASPVRLGEALAMSRGALTWRIAVPDDGALPLGGLMPVLIEWPPGPHACERMVDFGLRLERIVLRSSAPALLQERLASIGADGLADVRSTQSGKPALEAILACPDGRGIAIGGGFVGKSATSCA